MGDSGTMYMRRALELAARGEGYVNPNPLVGAVIVGAVGGVVAEGWHRSFGGAHAEQDALSLCPPGAAVGATMYVTLEPCNHHGKTPPCTEAIIAAGIVRVVVGCQDPNPLVGGGGIARLREAGLEVQLGVLERECIDINKCFFHYISTGLPYVTMKYAMTLDGRIATASGASKWITGKTARERVHADRNRNLAIMVGRGTVCADDPELTCRMEGGGRNPIRIICDTRLHTPLDSRIVRGAVRIPTIIATASEDRGRVAQYVEAGCEVLQVGEAGSGVDLRELMRVLGARGIDSILLEGGARLNWGALEAGIVSGVQAYVAPKFFGAGAPPVCGTGVGTPAEAMQLANIRVAQLGEDLLLEADLCLRE